MSNGLLIFLLFTGSLLLNIPIPISLGIATIGTILISGSLPLEFFVQALFNSSDSFPLLAVPFFVLAGDIMLEGGISKRLVNFSKALIGNVTGSMAIITVLTSAIFAAISGSGPATVAAVGGIMIPAMIAEKYDKSFACGLAAAAGALGPIIPPSICFVMYGIIAQVSITDLFMSGFVPGIVMAVVLIIFCYIVSKKNNFGQLRERTTTKEKLHAFNDAKWAILVPVIILGGIYSGVFTPTEAAIVACDYGLLVSIFIYKEIRLNNILSILARTTLTSGMVLILVGCATSFGRLLAIEQIPVAITAFIYSISTNKAIVLLIINIFLFFVGMFMDTLASIIILAPLLLNIVVPLGVKPLHFGIIMVMNLVIGMCTPPVGVNLFVASSLGGIPIEQTMKWLAPMIVVLLVVLMIFTYSPTLSTFLPNMLR
jgi:C4-dicarboxylate transporter DctM subunit